jgi:DNA segregation ATPase FtsK/SpoIIIE-like protein
MENDAASTIEAIFQELSELAENVEYNGEALACLRERQDARHHELRMLLLAIARKTGVALPDEIRKAELPEHDELYESARAAVIEVGNASTSYLQRRLGCGYSRAARLMDMLEERGVVEPGDGVRPRKVLVDA